MRVNPNFIQAKKMASEVTPSLTKLAHFAHILMQESCASITSYSRKTGGFSIVILH